MTPFSFITFSAMSWTSFPCDFSSLGNATSGIMISGWTSMPSACTLQAASRIARACIAVISGYTSPRRQPRKPSIGLNSCSCFTRSATSLALIPSACAASAWPFSSCGRNSCSGGSSVRIVTGKPFIARKMPSKSARWKPSSGRSAFSRSLMTGSSVVTTAVLSPCFFSRFTLILAS